MNDFTRNDTTYRQLTASDIAILTAVESPLLRGGTNEVENMLNYFYTVSHDVRELLKAKREGWEDAVLVWGSTVNMDDLMSMSDLMGEDIDNIIEAESEVIPDKDSSKK